MKVTANMLASLAGGKVDGNPEALITGFAPIEEATRGCVTFLANPKYTHHIYSTQAAAVIVADTFVPEHPVAATLIRVADPYATLAHLMQHLESMQQHGPSGVEQPCFIADGVVVPDDAYIGAFAYIGAGARLGKGVKIYPQAYVGENVKIGPGTVVRPGVKIYEDCRIGARCILHAGCVIGSDGFGFAPTEQGYTKIPQTGNVVIADDVEIGANTTIDRATFGSTVIGRGTKLDNLIQVAHNVGIGEHNVLAAQVGVAGSTQMGSWNRVGGQVGFAGHITVGDRNEFGAQTGVPNHVGSGQRLLGYPAVDARRFAKNHVYVNKLDALFKSVTRLEKAMEAADMNPGSAGRNPAATDKKQKENT